MPVILQKHTRYVLLSMFLMMFICYSKTKLNPNCGHKNAGLEKMKNFSTENKRMANEERQGEIRMSEQFMHSIVLTGEVCNLKSYLIFCRHELYVVP